MSWLAWIHHVTKAGLKFMDISRLGIRSAYRSVSHFLACSFSIGLCVYCSYLVFSSFSVICV